MTHMRNLYFPQVRALSPPVSSSSRTLGRNGLPEEIPRKRVAGLARRDNCVRDFHLPYGTGIERMAVGPQENPHGRIAFEERL